MGELAHSERGPRRAEHLVEPCLRDSVLLESPGNSELGDRGGADVLPVAGLGPAVVPQVDRCTLRRRSNRQPYGDVFEGLRQKGIAGNVLLSCAREGECDRPLVARDEPLDFGQRGLVRPADVAVVERGCDGRVPEPQEPDRERDRERRARPGCQPATACNRDGNGFRDGDGFGLCGVLLDDGGRSPRARSPARRCRSPPRGR